MNLRQAVAAKTAELEAAKADLETARSHLVSAADDSAAARVAAADEQKRLEDKNAALAVELAAAKAPHGTSGPWHPKLRPRWPRFRRQISERDATIAGLTGAISDKNAELSSAMAKARSDVAAARSKAAAEARAGVSSQIDELESKKAGGPRHPEMARRSRPRWPRRTPPSRRRLGGAQAKTAELFRRVGESPERSRCRARPELGEAKKADNIGPGRRSFEKQLADRAIDGHHVDLQEKVSAEDARPQGGQRQPGQGATGSFSAALARAQGDLRCRPGTDAAAAPSGNAAQIRSPRSRSSWRHSRGGREGVGPFRQGSRQRRVRSSAADDGPAPRSAELSASRWPRRRMTLRRHERAKRRTPPEGRQVTPRTPRSRSLVSGRQPRRGGDAFIQGRYAGQRAEGRGRCRDPILGTVRSPRKIQG